MSKKFNNNILLYVFIALIALFAIVKVYRLKFTDNTFNTNLVNIDTTKVSKILIYPTSENREEIKFYRDNKDWKVSKDKLIAEPEANIINNLLDELIEIKPQHLASRDKSRWAEFKVTDTTATRVKVFQEDRPVLDLLIGKFIYKQGNNMYGRMNGRSSGTSYVRLNNEKEVYAVEGFLTFSFNQKFNSFRKQVLVRFDKPNVNKVTFKYPGDSSFVVSLNNKKWLIGNQDADSVKVADYLNAIAYKSASSFNDNFVPLGRPQYQLIIEGNNMKTVTIDAYNSANNEYILNSNQNSNSWFRSPYKGLFMEIFKNNKTFLPGNKKKK